MPARPVLLALIVAIAAAMLLARGGERDGAAPPVAGKVSPTRVEAPTAQARRPAVAARPGRLAVDEYGPDPDAFVRQRHDYPPDTPERLGPAIGRVLFDLETIVDIVGHGTEEGERIHQVRGDPLDPDEQAAARTLLQEFFDEATPIVDDVLDGDLTAEAAFARLLALRTNLNCGLSFSLSLNEQEMYTLWPGVDGLIDADCFLVRPMEPERIPAGFDRRGGASPGPTK